MSNVIPLSYEGLAVRFNEDGWIDATGIAAKFGKEPTAWLRQVEVLEYLDALCRKQFGRSGFLTEISNISKLDSKSAAARTKILRLVKQTGLVVTKSGVNGGTWLHPRLAVRFARWLSVDFEIWCDEQIDAIIRGQSMPVDDERIRAIFLLNDPSSWEKRFKDPLYTALFRMSGLPRHRSDRKPMLFALISAKWIYGPVLPPNIYAEVKGMIKKGEKIHQYLKPDALTLVEHQIIRVASIANGCSDYRDFDARCMAAFPVKGQMKLLYAAA